MLINLLIFFVVLSVLIFFHELGHFAAAKLCGIYVKRFSIGMPPRVFGVKIGETDYCLGALPIGGFVMMAGQEDVPLSDEEREKEYGEVPPDRWFMNKPVWQRLFVLVMGPLMNLILAVVLYAAIAVTGSMVPEWEMSPRIGELEPSSPAAMAPLHRMEGDAVPDLSAPPAATGWRTGDLILSVDGRSIGNIGDLAAVAMLGGPDRMHDIVVEREGADGARERYFTRIAPKVLDESGYPRFGVGPFETAHAAGVEPGSAGEAAGLKDGDIIVRADGNPVSMSTFIKHVENVPEGGETVLEVRRGGETLSVAVRPQTVGRVLGMGIAGPETAASVDEAENAPNPVVYAVEKGLREKTGLLPKDIVLKVNGGAATAKRIRDLQKENPGGSLLLDVERPAIMFGLIRKASTLSVTVPVTPVRAVGVSLQPLTVLQRYSVAQAVPKAFSDSYLAVERTIQTIKGLVVGDVRAKDLGGPLMIYDVTTKAAEAGFGWLIKITAFISINLFVFNLLPLPVLDGGQVVTNTLEWMRGKPLNEKFLERFQQAGIVLVVALMIFVTYNDVLRMVKNLIP